MSDSRTLLSAAAGRVRLPVLLPLVGGNLLLMLVASAALLIPDSHLWQLLLSACFALGLVAGLLLWNAGAIRRLRAPLRPPSLWMSALLCLLWLIFAAWLAHGIGLAEPNVETRAGYWNSQLPHSLRYLFPFARLVRLQEFALSSLRWVVLPALLLPSAIESISTGLHWSVAGRATRVLLTARHWITTALTLGVAACIAPALAAWHPTRAVTGEIVSALLRLGLAGLLILAAVVLVLAVDAELLHRADRPAESSQAS